MADEFKPLYMKDIIELMGKHPGKPSLIGHKITPTPPIEPLLSTEEFNRNLNIAFKNALHRIGLTKNE